AEDGAGPAVRRGSRLAVSTGGARTGVAGRSQLHAGRGHDNDRNSNDVDDGAHRAPEESDRRRALMRTDRTRDRGEPQRRHREGKPARLVALQEHNRRAARAAGRPEHCAPQDRHSAPNPPSVAGETATCVRRDAGGQRQPLLSVRTSAVALPLAHRRPDRRKFRLLREQARRWPALLPGARPRSLSAGHPRARGPRAALPRLEGWMIPPASGLRPSVCLAEEWKTTSLNGSGDISNASGT